MEILYIDVSQEDMVMQYHACIKYQEGYAAVDVTGRRRM